MNKKELKEGIENELKKMLKRDQMIKDITILDLSKFEDKPITKRILTHINKIYPQYAASFYEVGSLKQIKIISRPINHNYGAMVEIFITFYQGDNFSVERFKEELNKWLNSSQNTLESLQKDINNIDGLVNKYNKIIDDVEEFQKISSYAFRDLINYQYSYNHKIALQTPDEIKEYNTTLLLLNMDNIKENVIYLKKNIDELLTLSDLQLLGKLFRLKKYDKIDFSVIDLVKIRNELKDIKKEALQ